MSQHLSTNLDFITSFIETCHAQGFNEKQAAVLLDNYSKNEFYLTDKDFREGVNETLKEASVPAALLNLTKALGKSVASRPGISVPALSGLAAGALTPEGILPEGYGGGAMAGGALGGLLGLIATRGKGLGTAIGNMGRAVSGGGVLRTGAKQTANLLTHPKLLKGTGLGALGGAAAVGGGKLKDFVTGRLPNISPNTGVPSYMQDGSAAAGGAANKDVNLFDLPGDILAEATGAAGAVGAGSSFLNSLKQNKQQLVNLDNQISQLQSTLGSPSNPAAYGQRAAIQTQLDNLKMQRNMLSASIANSENKFYNDTNNIINLANQREDLANRGLMGAQTEFGNIMRRKQLEQQGGVTGYLMSLYNRLAGTEDRLNQLDPIYSGYISELEKAKKLRELGSSNVLQ